MAISALACLAPLGPASPCLRRMLRGEPEKDGGEEDSYAAGGGTGYTGALKEQRARAKPPTIAVPTASYSSVADVRFESLLGYKNIVKRRTDLLNACTIWALWGHDYEPHAVKQPHISTPTFFARYGVRLGFEPVRTCPNRFRKIQHWPNPEPQLRIGSEPDTGNTIPTAAPSRPESSSGAESTKTPSHPRLCFCLRKPLSPPDVHDRPRLFEIQPHAGLQLFSSLRVVPNAIVTVILFSNNVHCRELDIVAESVVGCTDDRACTLNWALNLKGKGID
ncbi:hypothetical protein B0H16DRAFT_1481910 [Mycena metata]|uniref:Uncharacterized protein n=1 Tax=Mycena metata TaxID=1033252 RepID=A0AAD7GW96_9AGAR|nr:hypothetical protein B0H16DRAFT_1481910 [Mycena metata]